MGAARPLPGLPGCHVDIVLELVCDRGKNLTAALHQPKNRDISLEYGHKTFCLQRGRGLQSLPAGTELEIVVLVFRFFTCSLGQAAGTCAGTYTFVKRRNCSSKCR